MAAYLFTWNPKRWDWCDQADAISRTNSGENYGRYWSCGNTKRIQIGDQFFLMKLGVEPKGIIGCGFISSEPYLLTHWDEEKRRIGKLGLRTDILFNALSEDPIVPLEYLQEMYGNYNWTPQVGGLSVPGHFAQELFSLVVDT